MGDLVLFNEAFEHADQLVSSDGAGHFDGQALPCVLVDDVEQLEDLGIVGLVELEIDGPHHVGPSWAEGTDLDAEAQQGAFLAPVGNF